MRTYEKIETIFNRDTTGTKKLILDDFRNETVEFLKDTEWVFTEKIDGTNIRVYWDGHKVEFGGRTDNAEIPRPLLDSLNKIFGTTEAEELFEQTFGEKNVILFGEGYGGKVQGVGNEYRPDESFILFDVLIGEIIRFVSGSRRRHRCLASRLSQYYSLVLFRLALIMYVDIRSLLSL